MAIRERFLAGDFEPPPVPKTIPEALEVMTELVVPHERSFLGETTYQDFIGMSHHAMGRHMRNQWGFWAGEGELYERLCALGLSHADDMSGFLLCIWWCRLIR